MPALTRSLFSTILAVLGLAASASAQVTTFIAVNNPSFEAPTVPANPGYTNDIITGWSGAGIDQGTFGHYGVQSLAASPTLYPSGIPDGLQYAYANNGTIFQDVAATLTAGMTYTLTAYVGYRTDFGGSGSVNLFASDGTFLKGSGTVATPQGTFTLVTISFGPSDTALAGNLGKGIRIVLRNDAGVGVGQPNFDKVSLTQTAPAPEPSQCVVLSMGVLGLGALTLRARRRARA